MIALLFIVFLLLWIFFEQTHSFEDFFFAALLKSIIVLLVFTIGYLLIPWEESVREIKKVEIYSIKSTDLPFTIGCTYSDENERYFIHALNEKARVYPFTCPVDGSTVYQTENISPYITYQRVIHSLPRWFSFWGDIESLQNYELHVPENSVIEKISNEY